MSQHRGYYSLVMDVFTRLDIEGANSGEMKPRVSNVAVSNTRGCWLGYAVQIKDCNSCLEDVYDSHTRGFLSTNCHYCKYDQWENTYPVMIAKNPKRDFSLFLRDWYPNGFKLT